ncbi:MAG: cell division ATP-binding protein FtsE [Candidatus Sungbacteria bacterium RIFCSPLOWO2_02_FULL_54_10]|uniref:Cell division ATP-binding protein FtsE n=2 Tax=Candidatus Sungiibacteriota TaxID=1817917 RepID=A0A1G2L983_9BACT|nr:MAG: cell division ATP-binding protein FtsE [Candidatus Sungbacteria bacterium RIFCSPHIGHO2_01_FULL_54_26]OHA04211.1 MAG: cell division ATP-binding protein FtsE [Candidatus Sungbacteria bacterium RIFCSPHIGHO2_02_FULL_53_17]OHA08090.1 MAG: cell division ATP-binding protein FtsE [Candidatus Sungbacteria bacterium RIFCSPLOWO2_01_FULL_54_21]OHA13751.1 MAG: cell division ATP-binding protein FtsE [Candidatus Sungbacteria bacterium RIFCSPLOWO2_02_FULL_54_10]
MIFFDNVSKIYSHNSAAVRNVTLRIEPKEFVSLVGASGAGKTTLLKLLLREEDSTEGTIFLDGLDVTALTRDELHHVRRRIGTVFQDYKLLPTKTAAENVAFAMEAAGRTDAEIDEDVPQVLDLVGLADKMDNFPHQLSGGEKQRVAIARALVNRPDVLLGDEPTGNLDSVNTGEIVKLLKKINQLGTTVILATHDKQVINTLDKRVIVLDQGEIVSDNAKGTYQA